MYGWMDGWMDGWMYGQQINGTNKPDVV